VSDDGALDAGDFGSWLTAMRAALADDGASDVPCGSCTACCTASQFVHIAPDEHDALAHIPSALLFPAPRAPRGNVLMGYDEHGHCPMLIDGACSIYEHRPRTCRSYDCRVFPAAGLEPTDADKAEIAERVRRWRFRFADAADEVRHGAVRAAADHLGAHPEVLDERGSPTDTQRAVLAIEVHEAFVRCDEATGAVAPVTPSTAEVRIAIDRVRRRRSR
jgi:Fe-S-cluster containining protein